MKRSKKSWDWTPNNLRKTSNKGKIHFCNSCPKSYRQIYDQKYTMSDKKALRNELNGQDGIFSLKTRRGQARWDYW